MSESLEAYLRSLRAGLPPGLGTQHTARLLREIEEHTLRVAKRSRSGERHRRTRSNARWQGWASWRHCSRILYRGRPEAHAAGVWARGALLGGALGLGWLVFGVVAALTPTGYSRTCAFRSPGHCAAGRWRIGHQ